MRMRGRVALLVLSCLVACVTSRPREHRDDGGVATAPTEPVEADEAMLRTLPRQTCALFERCFGPLRASIDAPGGLMDNDLRFERCNEVTQTAFDEWSFPALLDSVASGRVRYDPDLLAGCLRADEQRECSEVSSALPACHAAFEGTVALGERCATQYDCSPDAFCDLGISQAASCPAVCKRRLEPGAACVHPAECAAGARCFAAEAPGLDRRCSPPTPQGQPCTGQHCAAGLFCSGSAPPFSCEPVTRDQRPGDPCSPAQQCANGAACRRDASGARTCASESAGQPCTLASECVADEYCGCKGATPGSCGAKQCLPWPLEGEPCGQGVINQALCAQGLFCENGKCRARLGFGEPCDNPAMCSSVYCLNGRCASPTECE